jgi:hypothetical protein
MSEITIDPMMPIRLEKKKNIASSRLTPSVLPTRATGAGRNGKKARMVACVPAEAASSSAAASRVRAGLLPAAGPGVLEEKAEGIEALDFLPRQATMTPRQH